MIVDYGLSNLTCVKSAVERLGYETFIATRGSDVAEVEKIILPGVGAYGDAMRNLRDTGLFDALNEQVILKKVPFLGICLGAQLICSNSDEFGMHEGLGWIDAFRKINTNGENISVPHTGWDDIELVRDDCPLLHNIESDSLFYYTHSHAIYSCNSTT